MSPPPDCPENACWQDLLAVSLPPGRREECERHLESCPVCQEHLDRAVDDAEGLLRLARQLGDPTAVPADPTVTQIRERLHGVRSPVQAEPPGPADLSFLRPAGRPGILGTLGNYEVTEVIGQGGMGVVLKAFEPALHRHVAIKVLAPALAASATARRRFTREAQAAAAVRHDHIVTVHGVAEAEGLPYLVMQYVPGESLQARLNRTGPLELAEVVRIGHQTASALAAAHAQGLIHRDIKPANILLENGLAKVKITDFGLARLVDDVPLTQAGVVAGTPEYMAPEQARGEPLDQRADLYALGAVLYACCTGGPPFRGETPLTVLRRVGTEAPRPIRELNPDVPAWLEALVGRLLARDPGLRFQNAAEVAALLEGYLAHLRAPATIPAPVLPVPPTARPRGATSSQAAARPGWGRRFRLPVLVLVVALGMAGPLLVLGALLPEQRRSATSGPFADQAVASPQAHSGLWLAATGLLGLVLGGSLLGGWLFTRRRRPTEPTAVAVPFISFRCPSCGKGLKVKAEWAGKKGKCAHCGKEALVPGAPAGVARRPVVRIARWAVAALALAVPVAVGGWLLRPGGALTPAGSGQAGFVNVTLGGEPVAGVEETGFSYQEYDQNQQPFRWTDGNARLVIPLNKNHPPGALFVRLHTYRPPEVKQARLDIVANEHPLFSGPINLGRWERTLDLKGIDLGNRLVLDLRSDTYCPMGNAPHVNGKGASDDPRTLGVLVRVIKLLPEPGDPAAGADLLQTWEGHPAGVSCGALAADGKTLVSGSWDGTVIVWDVAANQPRRALPGLAPNLAAVAVSPDGATFATATNDRLVRLWDAETGQPRATLRKHVGQITALAFAPDGKTLASVGGNRFQAGELKLWDVEAGTERVHVEPFPLRLWAVAYAPDGKRVAVAGGDKTAQVVDAETGKVLVSLPHASYVHRVAFSPDGKRLAAAYGDEGLVYLHHLDDGTPPAELHTPDGMHVLSLQFAPDGKRLVTGCADGSVTVWDVSQASPRAVTTFRAHAGQVWFALFLPDGRTLATGGEDRTIRLWRAGPDRL
jgi:WD40 repeat protein